jgi:CheY-specific phosphatase CheX
VPIAPAVRNPVFQLMVSELEAAAVELFEAYCIPARKSEFARGAGAAAPEPSNLAVMGFVGEGVRGALIMSASEASVVAWLEAMGETSGDCADVLGEFANMLLGRLKTRLIPVGLPVQVSTPTIASGNLRLSIPPVLSKWLVLEGEAWQLRIRLDTTFEPHFALRELGSTEAAPAQAGEAIFF